jgi:hypothetical protein
MIKTWLLFVRNKKEIDQSTKRMKFKQEICCKNQSKKKIDEVYQVNSFFLVFLTERAQSRVIKSSCLQGRAHMNIDPTIGVKTHGDSSKKT